MPTEKLKDGMAYLDKRINKDALTMLIVKECGPLQCMFGEYWSFWWNHQVWFAVNSNNINHLVETMNYEYSPIHNYDMDRGMEEEGTSHEESASNRNKENSGDYTDTSVSNYRSTENEKLGGKDELKHAYASSVTDDGEGTSHNSNERDLTTQVNGESHEERRTSAYNEDLYQPDNTMDEEHSETTTQTGTVTDNGGYTDENTRKYTGSDTDTTTYGKTKETKVSDDVTDSSGSGHESGTEEETITGEKDGNTTGKRREKGFGATGIYTKQQMIEQERQLAKFNLYEWIVRKYKRDNFYLVY